MSYEMEYTVENEETGEETTYTVEYTFYKGCRGSRDSYGVPLEPDDPAEIEITRVTDESGSEVDPDEVFTGDQLDEIQDKGCEDAMDHIEDAIADAQEAAYEARMEDW